MRILVTGGNGFVGSRLVKQLAEKNTVYVFDRARFQANQECPYIRGDIADSCSVDDAFEQSKPDVVVHLAGMVSRKECEETPLSAIRTNVEGTFNIARSSLRHHSRLIYSGSSEEYGTAFNDAVVTEGTPYGLPTGIYSMTKRMAEETVQYFSQKHGLKAMTVRFFMLYGPGEPATQYRSAIARFVDAALKNRPLTVHRNTSRSWCYVDDAIEALRMLVEREQDAPYESYNIGGSEQIATIDLANMILAQTQSKSRLVIVDAEPTVIPNKVADFRHIEAKLGWRAKTPLEEGLRRVIDDYASSR